MVVLKLLLSAAIVFLTAYLGNMKASKLKQREYICFYFVSYIFIK